MLKRGAADISHERRPATMTRQTDRPTDRLTDRLAAGSVGVGLGRGGDRGDGGPGPDRPGPPAQSVSDSGGGSVYRSEPPLRSRR